MKKRTLSEITPVRFFDGDKKKRLAVQRQHKGRWDNDAHFIRAAVQVFIAYLAQENRTKRYEQQAKERR
jgi:hypothetical protein